MLGDSWRHPGRLGLFTLLRKPRCADNDQTTHQDQLIAISVMLVAYPACSKKQGPLGRIQFTSPSTLCTTGVCIPQLHTHSTRGDTADLLLHGCSGRRCRVKVLTGCAPSVTCGEAILAPLQHPLACSYIQSLLRQSLCLF